MHAWDADNINTEVSMVKAFDSTTDRAFYPTECEDPDLEWLITTFLSERSNYITVEAHESIPFMLIQYKEVKNNPDKKGGWKTKPQLPSM